MEVVLLGTGSADGWPNAFCTCAKVMFVPMPLVTMASIVGCVSSVLPTMS